MLQAAAQGDTATLRREIGRNPRLAECHYCYVTPLYLTMRGNHVDTARYLMESTPHPFATWVAEPPLEFARHRGFEEMRRAIEEKMARSYQTAPGGEELAAAIREGELEQVRALLDAHPEWAHAGDQRGCLPIHWAAMTRQVDVIDELWRRGANLNARRADGAGAIHLCNGDYTYRGWRDVPEGRPAPAEVLTHLIARGAEVDIYVAAHRGDLERVRAWLDRDAALANTNSPYNSYYYGCGSALKNAAARGHIDIVRLLLERGADPNLREEHIAPNGHALYSAVYHGHFEVAKLLLEHGATPNAEVESSADAVSIAMGKEDQSLANLLYEYGGAQPVHLLAYYGDLRTAAAVFAANPATAGDPEAMSYAAGRQDAAFLRLMLRYAPRLPERQSVSDIQTVEIAELLFAHGLDANRLDWLGVPPLHRIAARGNVAVAECFLAHGAQLEARDEDLRSTPLGWAARAGRREMVEFLLARGSSRKGGPAWTTPRAWALARGHTEVASLLGE